MPISLKTQKALWGRAAARCAFPECRRHLAEDIAETDDPTLVGENCHIVAESDGGPRGSSSMLLEDRNRYANLILLCNVHHKIIDDNEEKYTVDVLTAIKREHEDWVEKSLGLDRVKLRDDAVYADYIDEWGRLAHLNTWAAWSSYVLGSGQPRIWTEVERDIGMLRRWLLTRIWPGRYTGLEVAFQNFQRVLQDFHETLRSRLDDRSRGNLLFTKKFYQIDEWDEIRYRRLSSQYDFHVDLVSDLMIELTRAANFVCDEIRKDLSYSYRLKDGHLSVERGPDENLQYLEFIPRYSRDELSLAMPYLGLKQFYTDREKRDWHIGSGHPPE